MKISKRFGKTLKTTTLWKINMGYFGGGDNLFGTQWTALVTKRRKMKLKQQQES
jgi:hypothetical protein